MCKRCAELEREVQSLREQLAWADGRRGETGRVRADGFTATETRILRKLATVGNAYNGGEECLQRHMSNIKRKLQEQGAPVEIETLVCQGYRLVKGKEHLVKMLSVVSPEAKPYRGSTIPGGAAIAAGWAA